jgi:hypothetical protein
MNEWLRAGIDLLIGGVVAWVTFRVRFERFESKDAEREKSWWEWRRALDQTIREREEHSRANTDALVRSEERVKTLERRMEAMTLWKHTVVDPYLPRAVDDHHRRLERIEARVFNGRRENER